MTGSDGNVFDEEMASAPPRNDAAASSTMSAVAGVSFTQTGMVATSFTACVTTEQSPLTLTTGCSPMVFVTTPAQPASNARMMLLSDSVGGADESKNGFSNQMPVNFVDRSAIHSLLWERVIVA